ncbi:MAG TPA: DUF3099 domain-containing protein [Candidatus Corynebacterium gallistercoris]|uniref:DUF3099 domain-containing protein n=1 Tax=Candidatus Corynebacterium gallistercoris TaxID=2838530 RepID=A0A9D1UPG3_9CORY|nr:DUF3099 domain-containing protein [Candidatus Corynebacterium gallistercoris]
MRTTVGVMALGKKRDAQLITDARRSPLENWHHRRRVYTVLQIARLPILAASGLLMWWTNNVALSVGVALISLPLPWVAVLLANESGEADKETRKVYKPGVVREQRRQYAAELERQRQAAVGPPSHDPAQLPPRPNAEGHAGVVDYDPHDSEQP